MKLVVLVFFVVASIACGAIDFVTSPTEPSNPVIQRSPNQSEKIKWDEASDYIGEYKSICGPVVDSHFASSSNGQPTFLNLGKAYPEPERFTVLIWGDDREHFPGAPEQIYLDKNICVYGLLIEYNNLPEVEVDDPSQIEIQ